MPTEASIKKTRSVNIRILDDGSFLLRTEPDYSNGPMEVGKGMKEEMKSREYAYESMEKMMSMIKQVLSGSNMTKMSKDTMSGDMMHKETKNPLKDK